MNPSEAEARSDEMGALINKLLSLPQDRKKYWIKRAVDFRSGPDSCNSVYMGSMATCRLIIALGGEYGKSTLDPLLERASVAQLDAALRVCAPVLNRLHEEPPAGESSGEPRVVPKYDDTRLTARVRAAARDTAVNLPEGLALLYWDRDGKCRAFSLQDHNLHFAVDNLYGVHEHYSEIIPV